MAPWNGPNQHVTAVGVDSTQQVLLEARIIKVVNHLIPVALQQNDKHT